MIYVMSDLHGCCDDFLDMLDLIHFSDQDELYILGDCIDRGPDPVPLLLECMARRNVHPLMGNHELIMLHCVAGLPEGITLEQIEDCYTPEGRQLYTAWMHNGGGITISQYLEMMPELRRAVLAYIQSFPLYRELTMPDGQQYVLTHSGIADFDPEKPLSEYPAAALTDARPRQDDRFYEDKMLVFGHTPTLTYPQLHGRAEVLFTETYINIDCGAVFASAGGRIACLRLDDREVFYL